MNTTTAITLSEYVHSPAELARFEDVLGKDAKSYIQSVLIAVSSSEDLMKCSHASIVRSALRAASLGLSCDPALKQAWIVPYNKKTKVNGQDIWVKEAQFQPHYKGLYTLAMRTGKYWQINVAPIYEGQRVMENPLTGLHAVQDGGILALPDSYNPAYSVDVTVRRKADKKVIGWIGYFKTKKGFEKSVYMSIGEIDDHARQYVRDYEKNPNWNDAAKRPVMEMKTVLRQLLSWADLSGTENQQLTEALRADEMAETVDAEVEPQVNVPVDVQSAAGEESQEFQETDIPINPTSDKAVKYAAEVWNVSQAEAHKQIAGNKKVFTNPMSKALFKHIVNGEA